MDNAQLLQRMLAAREQKLALFDGHDVTLRRPTDLELLAARDTGLARERVFEHVVGWSGFTEADLIPSGSSDAVPFSAPLWTAWIADHPEHWDKVANALVEMIELRARSRDDAAKN